MNSLILMNMTDSVISADDHWVLWTALVVAAALSMYLEQKNRIAAKLTGPVLGLMFGMFLSNTGLILWLPRQILGMVGVTISNRNMVPTAAVTYDIIGDYVVILAIPLLLMKVNIRKIIKEAGRIFGAFHLSSLGTVVGAVLAVLSLSGLIPESAKIGGMMTGSYIGGAVNFMAMKYTFSPTESLASATIVADNVVMAVYFLVLLALPTSSMVRKIFPVTERSRDFGGQESIEGARGFWKPKPISLLDIAMATALAFLVATISVKISAFFHSPDMPKIVQESLGQKFLVLTTVSIALPFFFPKFTEAIAGTEEIGTFFIYIFFVLIGIPASLKTVIVQSPLLLLFCALMLLANFVVTFGLGKLLGFELEELILVAAATSGGPMNAAAIAIAKGWKKLIVPSFLVGIWGYVIGNYIGIIMGRLLIRLVGP
ncbi:MAG: DUF819 family protein [Phycisphaerales bacterium]|nr:MAG: DUF819 family protein [Phycisphaerales bacterium]